MNTPRNDFRYCSSASDCDSLSPSPPSPHPLPSPSPPPGCACTAYRVTGAEWSSPTGRHVSGIFYPTARRRPTAARSGATRSPLSFITQTPNTAFRSMIMLHPTGAGDGSPAARGAHRSTASGSWLTALAPGCMMPSQWSARRLPRRHRRHRPARHRIHPAPVGRAPRGATTSAVATSHSRATPRSATTISWAPSRSTGRALRFFVPRALRRSVATFLASTSRTATQTQRHTQRAELRATTRLAHRRLAHRRRTHRQCRPPTSTGCSVTKAPRARRAATQTSTARPSATRPLRPSTRQRAARATAMKRTPRSRTLRIIRADAPLAAATSMAQAAPTTSVRLST